MKSKILLIVIITILAAMLLYPPFILVRNGSELNMGYAFLFNPPNRAIVNVSFLLVQWFFVLMISTLIVYFTKNNNIGKSENIRNSIKPLALRKTIILALHCIRIFIGLIFIWQIISLIPIYSWFNNISAITIDMMISIGIKLFVMVLCWLTYQWIKGFISRLSERYLLPPI
jgi:hypothetical protein